MAFRGRNCLNRENVDTNDLSLSYDFSQEEDDINHPFDFDDNNGCLLNDDILSQPIDYIFFNNVSEENRTKYIQKMVNDADVHYHKITFNIGDLVIVSKSSDTNVKTKKDKMGDFYEEGIWLIVENVGFDSYKIMDLENEDKIRIVQKNRLKVVKSSNKNH